MKLLCLVVVFAVAFLFANCEPLEKDDIENFFVQEEVTFTEDQTSQKRGLKFAYEERPFPRIIYRKMKNGKLLRINATSSVKLGVYGDAMQKFQAFRPYHIIRLKKNGRFVGLKGYLRERNAFIILIKPKRGEEPHLSIWKLYKKKGQAFVNRTYYHYPSRRF